MEKWMKYISEFERRGVVVGPVDVSVVAVHAVVAHLVPHRVDRFHVGLHVGAGQHDYDVDIRLPHQLPEIQDSGG